jgi:PucR family transcriptional regulator, purine catabolism regulatory protein
MAITILQALNELPILSTAIVVAGKESLNQQIRWTHIVDNPEVIPWVRQGDLLVTTGFSLRDQPEIYQELISSLVKKQLSGMIISVGKYIDNIPPAIIHAAEKEHFPLIALPWEVALADVTHAIHERIINEQYTLNEQAFRIHKVLTQLVLEGEGLDSLAEKLADLLDRPITIEDSELRLLAHARIDPVDPVRLQSIDQTRTPDAIVAYLEEMGVFEQMRLDPGPKLVPAAPLLGLDYDRIIAPIMVGKQCFGYLWIIATNRSLGELDYLAIERGAMVAALILTREDAVFQAEQRVKSEMFENLMDTHSKGSMMDLVETMKRLGLQAGYQIGVVEQKHPNQSGIKRIIQITEQALRQEDIASTLIQKGSRLVILLGTISPSVSTNILQDIIEINQKKGEAILVGISAPIHQADRVRQSYQDAVDTIQIGKKLNWDNTKVWRFEQVGYLDVLLNLPNDHRDSLYYYCLVQKIAQFDQDRNSDYINTLEAYFDHFCNANQTAEDIFIHRNTLRQRLARIQENWKVDLEDPTCVLNLQIAIKQLRLGQKEA